MCQQTRSHPETGLEEINGDLREEDFGQVKSAIKCRIRFAVTQAEAAIAMATLSIGKH